MAHLSMYIMMYPYPPSTQRSLGFLALFHDIPRLFPAPTSRSATHRGARLAVYKIAFSDLTKKTFYCCPSPKRMSRKGSEWSLKCQMCRWFLSFWKGKKRGAEWRIEFDDFFCPFMGFWQTTYRDLTWFDRQRAQVVTWITWRENYRELPIFEMMWEGFTLMSWPFSSSDQSSEFFWLI